MGDYALIDDYAVIDPATGERLATFPQASQADIDTALDAAASACESWGRASSPAERAALIRRVAELHGERREDLAAAIGREMGKPMEEALGEVDFCREIYEYYADNAARLHGRRADRRSPASGTAVIRRSPHGRAARDHAVELPVLPGGPLRGPEPRHRQHDPAQARAAVPGVGRGHRADLPATPGFPEGAYVNIYATDEQVGDDHRRPARARASR